ncbi:FAD-dependent oxidoreductase [Arenibaculum pallidiluteum]|uniref:FAD-dependent oxidoreductase n=1 Tax=Arenibaculum pallidiluteum TaxID=2812559 RepID=UPI001A9797E2|nr:FAD-dependent oxidoreductase [Arenibaculum pallidiluteum]
MTGSSARVQTGGYDLPVYDYVRPPELAGGPRRRYPVVIVGGGLSGLTAACDLACRGIEAVLLDEDDTIGVRGASSRGICYAQKSLEIFDRLGIYQRIRDKGITWSVGKVVEGEEVLYSFDLAPGSASAQPPFINIQQFYVEWFLVDRIRELGRTDLRWKNRVTAVRQGAEHAVLSVETPDGAYEIEADWVVDATGLASPIRDGLGLPTHPERGEDRWCISDVRFRKPLPTERWTWVEAPFNENRAVWQHLMADGVWRIDYQMAPNADPAEVSRTEVAEARLRAHLGPEVEFEVVWVGPYSYRTHLMDDFRCGRVLFIGDAAHVMSPFGARGGNSGIQDADNLGWKLALVLRGEAPESLLDSFDAERRPAAAHNIKVTSRTGRFLAPRTEMERIIRKAVLDLSTEHPFARLLLNTGRMSAPFRYDASPLNTGAEGEAVPNVRLGEGVLSDLLRGEGAAFVALWAPDPAQPGLAAALQAVAERGWPVRVFACGAEAQPLPHLSGSGMGLLGLTPGTLLLVRPDQHLAARIRDADPAALEAALARALCRAPSDALARA